MKLSAARTIIAAALQLGTDASFRPLAVVVLDAGGHLIAFERQDGSANKRFEIAYGKAHGALALGVGSRSLMNRAILQPYFVSAATSAIGGALIPVPGGVLIRDAHGRTLGAVGATGDTSDNDESAAVTGIEAAGFVADTG